MKISVAMCTYNGAAYLKEQLESIAAQTRLPDEIVICDDLSTDDTVEIIRGFRQTVSFPVRLFINRRNLGVVRNFEKAISLSAGEIIALSDQDDVWMPEKLAVFEREFTEKPNVGFVFTDGEVVDENLNSLHRRIWDFYFSERKRRLFEQGKQTEVLVWTNTVTGATAALRGELKRRLTPLPKNAGFIHDGWIALLAACHSHVSVVSQPLIKYRQHPNQQCGLPKNSGSLTSQTISLKEQHRQTLAGLQLRVGALAEARDFCLRREVCENFENECKSANEASSLKPPEAARAELDKAIKELNEMIKHLERRKDLPSSRFKRLNVVLDEFFAGNYFRYSKGFGSAVKDMIE